MGLRKPHDILWPLNQEGVEKINHNFDILFRGAEGDLVAHNVLSVPHGDTTAAAVVRGDLIIGSGSPAKWTRLGKGTDGMVLMLVSGLPAWAAPLHTLLGAWHSDASGEAVIRGAIIYGKGATPVWSRLLPGAVGEVLTMGASEPEWAAAGGAGHDLLSATHPDTTPAAVQRGDLVIGQGAVATWQRKAIGAAGTVLGSDGVDATWGLPPSNPLLDGSRHNDTEADAPERNAIIVGRPSAPLDRAFDGALVGLPLGSEATVGSKYWFDGAVVAPLDEGGTVLWRKLEPPTVRGQALTYDGSDLSWGAPGLSDAVLVYRTTDYSIVYSTLTPIPMDAEEYDGAEFHDTTTNPSRVTVPVGKAGRYLVIAQTTFQGPTGTHAFVMFIRQNGTTLRARVTLAPVNTAFVYHLCGQVSAILMLAEGDYVESVVYWERSGAETTWNVKGGVGVTFLQVQRLG